MWFNGWRGKERARVPGRRVVTPPGFRPRVEELEERRVPAVMFGGLQTFGPNIPGAFGLSGLVSGDFTGDGRLDLVSTSGSTAQVSLSAGIGNGTFRPAI